MTPTLILDCSIAMAWCFADERSTETDAVQERLITEAALVPGHWFLEVVNVLAMAEKRQRISQANSAHFLGLLATLDVQSDEDVSLRAFDHLLPLCRAHGLTSYDAAYLDLALRQQLPLATLDGELRGAATALGIPLLGK